MSIYEVCAVGILATAALMVLKDSGSRHTKTVVIILGVMLMGRAVLGLGEVVKLADEISDGGRTPYVKTLLKAAGIAYLVDLAAGLCRDAGESSVAEYVELAGKSELMLLSLPIITDLLELSFGMLE